MLRVSVGAVVVFLCLGLMTAQASTVTVTIPDPSPSSYILFGVGDATVTYSGVVFTQSSLLSNGQFFNVGPVFSGYPPVLSSQEQTTGIANILITLPSSVSYFAVNYGTFEGSGVTFTLSNGYTTTLGSTGSGYDVPDFFSYSGSPFSTVLVTSPDFVLNINNIVYGSVERVTPEPGTLVLLCSGALALGGSLTRKLRR